MWVVVDGWISSVDVGENWPRWRNLYLDQRPLWGNSRSLFPSFDIHETLDCIWNRLVYSLGRNSSQKDQLVSALAKNMNAIF